MENYIVTLKKLPTGEIFHYLTAVVATVFFVFLLLKNNEKIKRRIKGLDISIGGQFSSTTMILVITATVAIVGIFFGVNDQTSFWVSAFVFLSGTYTSYKTSQMAGFDGALVHFKEVVIGSINIGLMSIKKLSDTPPEQIALQTTGSLYFLGVAGEKFIKKCMNDNDFFRRNKTPQNVRFLLMDPFSDDMKTLSGQLDQQTANRRKIIETLVELSEREKAGYKFEVRLYPKVPPLRLMISDGRISALSVYSSNETGWKNSQLVFDSKNCPDSLAPYFTELFNDLWERGLSVNLNIRAEALKKLYDQPNGSDDDIAMVHGCFQGFHHEHLEYIIYGITHSKKCIIGVTRPNQNEKNSCDTLLHRDAEDANPYSYEERKSMISESLDMLGIDRSRYKVIPFNVDDMSNIEDEIIERAKDLLGGDGSPIDVKSIVQYMKIFGPWEKEKKVRFEQKGFSVRVIKNGPHVETPKNVTGTMVRELIQANRNWRDFVAPGTRRVIDAKPKEVR